ncbi:uncharacterized protein LOC135355727 [Latimeria chalumnae]|uniref:uncharacterized protein LOC135355727 n=1 Tax=Latimeria chalumnae TaxID=7897 RepID=UPI00313BD5AF
MILGVIAYSPLELWRLCPFDFSWFPLAPCIVTASRVAGITRRKRRCIYRGGFDCGIEGVKVGEPWGRLPRRRKRYRPRHRSRCLIPIKRLALKDFLKVDRLEEGELVTRTVLLNARSICNKTAIIYDLLRDNIDLAFITETWLDDCAATILAAAIPPGFLVIHCPRLHRRGGGLAICFRSSLNCTRNSWKETSPFEYMIAVCEAVVNFKILLVYRPPRWNADFVNELSELISFLVLESPKLLVVGDFNARIDDPSDNLASELSHTMQALGFTQFVKTATHEGGHVLDLVFSMGISIMNLKVTPVAWSDHFLVHFDVGVIPPSRISLRKYKFRPKHLLDSNKFREMALSSVLPFSKDDGVDLLVDNYNLILSTSIDSLAPLCIRLERSSNRAPWFNGALRLLKTSGRKLERRWRVSGLVEDRLKFRHWLTNYQLSIREAKSSFFASVIDSERNKPAALFRVVNNLLNPDCLRPRENLSLSCNTFLSFFSDKVDLIRSGIISSCSRYRDDITYLDETTPLVLWSSFVPTSDAQIVRVVRGLNATTCDFDPCPSRLLKEGLEDWAPLFTGIVNASLREGILPVSLKRAQVRPLLKQASLDPSDLSNYRPISNLPFLSKVIEKVVAGSLREHLDNFGLYDSFQSGFRPGLSTETALVKVVNDLLISMDKGLLSFLVQLDLSSAFDTIDHGVLLDRLEHHLGISGTVLKWFQSFLNDRSQVVRIGDSVSVPAEISCGVPFSLPCYLRSLSCL